MTALFAAAEEASPIVAAVVITALVVGFIAFKGFSASEDRLRSEKDELQRRLTRTETDLKHMKTEMDRETAELKSVEAKHDDERRRNRDLEKSNRELKRAIAQLTLQLPPSPATERSSPDEPNDDDDPV